MQDAVQIARRALVLAAVTCRGFIEKDANEPDAVSLHGRVLDWLTRLNLWSEAESSEEATLRVPLGQLSSSSTIAATWHVEGLAVLAWALKRLNLPLHDEQVDGPQVADAVCFLDDGAQDMVAQAELRSQAELAACRELMYAIHCRLRNYIRNRQPKDFAQWIEQEWLDTLGLDAVDLIIDKDLAIKGKAIHKASEEHLEELGSIIRERHRAIIWLVEGEESYSQTTADT